MIYNHNSFTHILNLRKYLVDQLHSIFMEWIIRVLIYVFEYNNSIESPRVPVYYISYIQ